MRRWFQRIVLARRWLTFIVMGLSFFVFGVGTVNLFMLFRENADYISRYGWEALMDGAARQLVELLVTGYVSIGAYLVFDACKYQLVHHLTDPVARKKTIMTHRQSETPESVQLEPAANATASVIWLHGLGADGHDFVPIVPELELPAAVSVRFVFPHAPIRPVTINNGMRMRAWYDILALSGGARQDEAGIRDSAATLDDYIARERERGVAARRIVIAGFSQGGAIALHGALRYPERLGGVMALSTYLPLHERLAEEAAAANRDLPILMCHGTADPMLPVSMGEQSRDLLLAAGYPVEWKAYPMQHQVSLAEIADIAAWLGKQLQPAGARAR